MANEDEDPGGRSGRGIVFFSRDDAVSLDDSEMMTPATIAPEVYRNIDLTPIAAGSRTMALFQGEGPDGFSLVTASMKPGYRLPRHTHTGDCLYLVTKGSVLVGRREVTEGSGFLVKSGQPYAYSVGNQGAEVVEFRTTTSFDMQILDQTVERWKPIVDVAVANQELWSSDLPQ